MSLLEDNTDKIHYNMCGETYKKTEYSVFYIMDLQKFHTLQTCPHCNKGNHPLKQRKFI